MALVVGVPIDFRLGFGGSFGEETKIVRLDVAPNALTANRAPEVDLVGDVARQPGGDPRGGGGGEPRSRAPGSSELRSGRGGEARRPSRRSSNDPRSPLHPVRVYSELGEVLDRDAIVVGDGGDFVSYAGRFIDTYEPGCWMDPGPFGCLGAGPGQAIGAKVAHPDRQVCLLLGDGAFGFAGMEFDTMARHGLGVVGVMGNNGIWALEHHPMKFLYGYSVAAELRPETRYDELVEALGCDGVLVREPERAAAGAGAGLRVGPADPGQRPHRPRGRLPAQVESGLSRPVGRRDAAVPQTRIGRHRWRPIQVGPSGRAGVRLQGPCVFDGLRRREAP